MAIKYSTSINIIRDTNRDLNYIPTPNALRVVDQMTNDFKKGIRSFNIIGSYGTGKSAFLWALQQSVIGNKKYFNINFLSKSNYEFLQIVGDFHSLIDTFSDYFELSNKKNSTELIFTELFNKYHDIKGQNKILFIVLDEFGKVLKYASKNEPEKELYFI